MLHECDLNGAFTLIATNSVENQFCATHEALASSGCHFVRNAFLSTKWVSKGASLNFPVQELSVLSGRIRENRLRVLVTMQVVGFLSPWSRTHGCLNIVPTSYFTLVQFFDLGVTHR